MNTLDRKLELFSLEEPPAGAVTEAQRKLEQVLAGAAPRRPKRRARSWLAAAASAAAAVIAVVLLPLNPTQALAFSDVQKHFRDFQKLRFDMEQRVNGNVIMKSRIAVLANGSVRTEVGDDIVVVVNTQERRVLTLVKGQRVAVVSPLPAPGTKEDAMDWLSEIRDFQGLATPLPDTRIIDGLRAHGWELQLPTGQGKVQLWADDAGLPLEMKVGEANTAIDTRFRFEFEPALPADSFSTAVPAGYTLQPSED
jgi:outer membrane lipoprotein-sorting protein